MNPSRPYALPALDAIVATPAPVTSTQTASEPALISSSQGSKVVDQAQQQLTQLKGEPMAPTETPIEPAPKEVAPIDKPAAEKAPDFVTYVNPETGQETTLRGGAITDAAKKNLEARGFQVSEEDRSQAQDTTMAKLDDARKQAESDYNNTITQLQSSAISSGELRQSLNRIKEVYKSRMKSMQNINRRREQTLSTLGIRLGSRYAGGQGGAFGSILAEEERQGIERIGAIEADMLNAMSQAEKAAKDHNYSVFVKLTEKAKEKYDEKVKAYADLEKIQKEQQKAIQEEENNVANQASVLEQIQAGTTSPIQIFQALGGVVPFDVIKEITDTLPQAKEAEQFTLGRYDVRYDSEGNLIAKGMGGGAVGGTNISGTTSFGAPTAVVGAPTVAGLGNSYANSTPEAQMVIDDILNKIPAQLRNTEKETALKIEQIRKQLAAGYTYQQVVDRLSGFSLQGNMADKSLGNALYNASLGTDIDVGQLASLINRGAGEQAMTTVENKQLGNVQSFFAPVDKARATVKQADVVLKLLNDPTFPKDALGAFDGRTFKVTRFFGLNDTQRQKVQQLESALQLLASPIRVEVAGTAATDSEMGKISAFQSDILDQPDTIKTQVSALRDAVVNFHNEARSQRGLPQVSDRQLIDNKARLELYREAGNVEQGVVNSKMSNSSLLDGGAWNGNTPAKTPTGDNKSFFNGL